MGDRNDERKEKREVKKVKKEKKEKRERRKTEKTKRNDKYRSNLSNKTKRICVVGAGLSGLTCALRLEQLGYSVTVLESKEQVGGMTEGVEHFGEVFGLGAVQWSLLFHQSKRSE